MLLLYLARLSLPLLIAFLASLADRLRISTGSSTLATSALLGGLAMAVIPRPQAADSLARTRAACGAAPSDS